MTWNLVTNIVIYIAVMTLLLAVGVLIGAAIQEATAEHYRRQRMAEEVARATSRLRRLEHETIREMYRVADAVNKEGGDDHE